MRLKYQAPLIWLSGALILRNSSLKWDINMLSKKESCASINRDRGWLFYVKFISSSLSWCLGHSISFRDTCVCYPRTGQLLARAAGQQCVERERHQQRRVTGVTHATDTYTRRMEIKWATITKNHFIGRLGILFERCLHVRWKDHDSIVKND
jgi:hypothetical protein